MQALVLVQKLILLLADLNMALELSKTVHNDDMSKLFQWSCSACF